MRLLRFQPIKRFARFFSTTKSTMEKIPTRSEVKQEDKWNVEGLYPSIDDWKIEFKSLQDLDIGLKGFQSLKGNIPKCTPTVFKSAIESYLTLQRKIGKLHTYAHLRHDEDTTEDENKSIERQSSTLSNELGEKTSWFEPELLSLPDDAIKVLIISHQGSHFASRNGRITCTSSNCVGILFKGI
jgi:oligoendopeptidase F